MDLSLISVSRMLIHWIVMHLSITYVSFILFMSSGMKNVELLLQVLFLEFLL